MRDNEQTAMTEKLFQSFSGRFSRLAVVMAGIVLGQFLLYGPSLMGKKILLPLNVLARPNGYLPDTPQHPNSVQDTKRGDLVLQFEPDRRFAVKEFSEGRFPFWSPAEYGGVPLICPKFSPFFLFTCLTASPVILAWAQLLAALVAGTGAYLFFRRALCVGFWPATLAAWCHPMTGFFIFWQGHPVGGPVCWLPWLLLAVDRTVRGHSIAPVMLALVTGVLLASGQIDVAALALLVSGLFALWCLRQVHGRPILSRKTRKAALVLVLGWGLGFLLAAPNILPVVEYASTGQRISQRFSGQQERPPIGLAALPQVVLPNLYGTSQSGSLPLYSRIGEPNLPESPAAAYAGLLATLVVAPLAWCSRRHRSMNVFWTLLAVFGLSWGLDLPGIVDLMSLPGLNMLSYNRLVFATSFAILALTAIGLEALSKEEFRWHWGFWLPAALLAVLLLWCQFRMTVLPEPLATQIEKMIQSGQQNIEVMRLHDMDGLRRVQRGFSAYYKQSAAFCGVGLALWLVLRFGRLNRRILTPLIGVLLLGDLLWFGRGRNYQCDPALYYPEIPALRDVARAAPGRIIGYNCFPADFAEAVGLCDVRGYDGVDPARWVSLVTIGADRRSIMPVGGVLQNLVPRIRTTGTNTVRLSPVLDLLGVRYVIFRGSPPQNVKPAFQSPDYWVLENNYALPRVFIPHRVETVPDENERLEKLALPDFNPSETACVETPVDLPPECRGAAKIINENPTRIVVTAKMETAGLLVLADRWDKGWRAWLDGKPVPILKSDQAIRGVVLPAGSATVEFRYASTTVACGFLLAAGALATLLAWLAVAVRASRTRGPATVTMEKPDGPDNTTGQPS